MRKGEAWVRSWTKKLQAEALALYHPWWPLSWGYWHEAVGWAGYRLHLDRRAFFGRTTHV